jgi:alkylhydroperoxidase/carboxymuconolactone decarboxylase family protein YurZ
MNTYTAHFPVTRKETMSATKDKKQDFIERYGELPIETGSRLQGEFFLRMVEEFDDLDQDWTAGWLNWIYGNLYNRGVLDDKTRVLTIIGECCVSSALVQLPNHIRTAFRVGATEEEVLEVILHSAIYGGMPKMIEAMRVYRSLMRDLGRLEASEPTFRGDARD